MVQACLQVMPEVVKAISVGISSKMICLNAIIQLPNNLFYNTGITTYIWLLNNNKAEKRRKGKVQLIDANLLYRKLRKNLGKQKL